MSEAGERYWKLVLRQGRHGPIGKDSVADKKIADRLWLSLSDQERSEIIGRHQRQTLKQTVTPSPSY